MNKQESGGEHDDLTLTGIIDRVVFHSEDTGYSVLKVRVPRRREPATVIGRIPVVTPGESLQARGNWVDDPDHGRQFKAAKIKTSQPESLEGIERYLASGLIDGIGPVYAKKLIEKFGVEVIDIIENRSPQLEEVDGIGPKRRREIKESWTRQRAIHGIMIFLHDHGIGTGRAVRIYKEYGDQAVAKLEENPYQLARDLHGVGFKTADRIARDLGISQDSPSRISAGVLHVLHTAATSGHSCLPCQDLGSRTAELLEVRADAVTGGIAELVESRELVTESTGPDTSLGFVFSAQLHAAECAVARRLRRLAGEPVRYPDIDRSRALSWCQEKLGIELATGQKEAIELVLQSRLSVITGGPGTGKTTIMKSILAILTAKHVEVVLAAPTGRAAKRLAQAAGLPAKTLHRLLDYQPASGWGKNRHSPLVGDLFVVDEASMVDLPLMERLLDALPDSAHLLLVGDADQLPSVGPGRVLGDIISSRTVPVASLSEIFRQAAESQIVRVAHAVNSGLLPELHPSPDSDFFFLECESGPEEILKTVVDLVKRRLPTTYRFDPARDIQILSPMQRNLLGAKYLNAAMQDALNPAREHHAETPGAVGDLVFRAGDKVIQLRNNYDKEVFNGDIGFVRGIEFDPLRMHVAFEDGRSVMYDPGDFDELGLAYAITVHKSQGSEFQAVVIPLASQHYLLLQRNLLYTAITRGRRLVVVVGEKSALKRAVATAGSARHTTLSRRLREG